VLQGAHEQTHGEHLVLVPLGHIDDLCILLCALLSTLHVPAGKNVLRKEPMSKHLKNTLCWYL
jgi:hypothetical protein